MRFAPGFLDEDSEEFWTYAFVWWVPEDSPIDPESLSTHLEAYFRGLATSVAKSREFDVGNATFSASLTGTDDGIAGVA